MLRGAGLGVQAYQVLIGGDLHQAWLIQNQPRLAPAGLRTVHLAGLRSSQVAATRTRVAAPPPAPARLAPGVPAGGPLGARRAGGAGVGGAGRRLQEDWVAAAAGRLLQVGEAAAPPTPELGGWLRSGRPAALQVDVALQQAAQRLGLFLGGQQDEGLDRQRGGPLGPAVAPPLGLRTAGSCSGEFRILIE